MNEFKHGWYCVTSFINCFACPKLIGYVSIDKFMCEIESSLVHWAINSVFWRLDKWCRSAEHWKFASRSSCFGIGQLAWIFNDSSIYLELTNFGKNWLAKHVGRKIWRKFTLAAGRHIQQCSTIYYTNLDVKSYSSSFVTILSDSNMRLFGVGIKLSLT